MVLRTLAQRLSQHEDIAAEVCLLDKRVRPHGLHQIVFRDQFPVIANQNQENLKRLRLQGDGFTGTQQDFLLGINAKRAELVEFPELLAFACGHRGFPRGESTKF